MLLGLLAAAGVLLGASASPAAADAGVGVVRHGALVSDANALIAEVRVSLNREARLFVEYDNPEAGRYRTALSAPGAAHLIPIVRLRPDTTYDYTIFVAGGREAAAGPGGRFTTGALPPQIATVPVRTTGRSSQPLILADFRRFGELAYLLFHDETGSIVWYNLEPYSIAPVDRLPGGNLIFLDGGRLTEMTALGEVVSQFGRGGQWGNPHHDVTVLEDGRVIYPSREILVLEDLANGSAAETTALVDHLRVWDPENGRVERVWDAKEAWDISDRRLHLSYDSRGRLRWTHLNSVSIGPRGNVILSLAGRNQVISLSPDFRTIEWQLGGPDSDFAFPNPGDRFYGQHTAAQLANGNVLLFDNGWDRPEAEGGRYSRALELRLDDHAAAIKVWEYRPDPGIYAHSFSSAYRLSNGNTLVRFSARERLTDALLVVEADAAGNELFRLEHLPWYAPVLEGYRAHGGIASIMGETMLRPPASAHVPAHAETVADGFTMVRTYWSAHAEIAAGERGAPTARAEFDLYLDETGAELIYRKEPCAPEDLQGRLYLHVFPADPSELAAHEQQSGFYNRGFFFREYGVLLRDGACVALVPLPAYKRGIARVRTGEFNGWNAEFKAGE